MNKLEKSSIIVRQHLRLKESAYSGLHSYSAGVNHTVSGKQECIFTVPLYEFAQGADHPLAGQQIIKKEFNYLKLCWNQGIKESRLICCLGDSGLWLFGLS